MEEVGGEGLEHEGKAKSNTEMGGNAAWKVIRACIPLDLRVTQ